MKMDILPLKIFMMSSIVISTCLVIYLEIICYDSKVYGESTILSVPLNTEQSTNFTTLKDFTNSLRGLVSMSTELTGKYQQQLGKWVTKENDNSTMISITDEYLPQFERLVNEAGDLHVPFGQEKIKDSFIKSISLEASSYEHFRNYIITGNTTENELSNNEFSLAFQYEQIYATFLLKNR